MASKSFPGVRGSAPGAGHASLPHGRELRARGKTQAPPRDPATPGLDTSAQLGTDPPPLTKRARRKYISKAIASALADYVKSAAPDRVVGYQLWEKSYRNSAYCCEELKQDDGKVTGRYCGNRWCLVCSAIRTARIWQKHGPVVESWRKAQFMTVTRRNVTAAELPREIASMLKDAAKIADAMRNRDGVKFVALRKLEVTYNADTDTYHPHFHFIVETRQMARLFIARWMDICGDRADWKAQHVKDANRSALAELLKYFTKMVAKSKLQPPHVLHEIFAAMKRKRVYQNTGYTVESDDDDEESEIELEESTPAITRRAEVIVWEWCQSLADWVDLETGECLTDYAPGARFRAFVEGIA